MAKPEPRIESIEVSSVPAEIGQALESVRKRECYVLLKEGDSEEVAIVSARDFALYQSYLAKRAERFDEATRISEHFVDVPLEELEREVARALAEVRAEARRTGVPDSLAS